MKVRFRCHKCLQKYRFGTEHAGRRFHCALCDTKLTVPLLWGGLPSGPFVASPPQFAKGVDPRGLDDDDLNLDDFSLTEYETEETLAVDAKADTLAQFDHASAQKRSKAHSVAGTQPQSHQQVLPQLDEEATADVAIAGDASVEHPGRSLVFKLFLISTFAGVLGLLVIVGVVAFAALNSDDQTAKELGDGSPASQVLVDMASLITEKQSMLATSLLPEDHMAYDPESEEDVLGLASQIAIKNAGDPNNTIALQAVDIEIANADFIRGNVKIGNAADARLNKLLNITLEAYRIGNQWKLKLDTDLADAALKARDPS